MDVLYPVCAGIDVTETRWWSPCRGRSSGVRDPNTHLRAVYRGGARPRGVLDEQEFLSWPGEHGVYWKPVYRGSHAQPTRTVWLVTRLTSGGAGAQDRRQGQRVDRQAADARAALADFVPEVRGCWSCVISRATARSASAMQASEPPVSSSSWKRPTCGRVVASDPLGRRGARSSRRCSPRQTPEQIAERRAALARVQARRRARRRGRARRRERGSLHVRCSRTSIKWTRRSNCSMRASPSARPMSDARALVTEIPHQRDDRGRSARRESALT